MEPPSRRRSCRALGARGLLAAALLGAVLASPTTEAAVVLDTYHRQVDRLEPGRQRDVPVEVPFHLDRDGRFYAKLLGTPWNPINDGRPNGTIRADHTAGLSGWWIRFELADGNGTLLASDGRGAVFNPDLGVFVDSTSTAPVFLAGGTSYMLVAVIHVPGSAALSGATYRVPFALASREGNFTGDTTSGARLDQSRGFTAVLSFAGQPSGGGPAGPSTGVSDGQAAAGTVFFTGGMAWLLLGLVALGTATSLLLLGFVLRVLQRPPRPE